MSSRAQRLITHYSLLITILITIVVLVMASFPHDRAARAPPSRPEADAAGPRSAGWATIASPSLSTDDVRAMLTRQIRGGANIVWVGHNNPGEVDASTAE